MTAPSYEDLLVMLSFAKVIIRDVQSRWTGIPAYASHDLADAQAQITKTLYRARAGVHSEQDDGPDPDEAYDRSKDQDLIDHHFDHIS